ncbi:MAG: Proline--tRNA ligase [Chlamydiales bacterium]|nr:Proline--tRNA ligase [Chlamydiales bacterium]MCH9620531.1 Proline--tRNA ligase [Chlamydiales bacterium]MCH9623021.1 Proline--tRNA ligase [Chlamydiales bacterium]
MKLSTLLFRTLKQAPHDADIPSHKLLEQAGYIQKVGKGLYSYSPLMWRVLKKLMTLIREEMDKAGAQEVSLPQLHPSDLWEKTGRWNDYINEGLLYTIEGRDEHAYCIAPTAEELSLHLVSDWVKSYRNLPLMIYQINNKFRDEIRPRFGLMRSKEFLMKDTYSFAPNSNGMETQYASMREAYSAIFNRLGLQYVIVNAHGGKISTGGKSEEFQVTAEIGEDLVMVCDNYAANVEATISTPPPVNYDTKEQPKEKISTPNVTTIEELATLTKLPPTHILKTLVYKLSEDHFIAVGIRGDRQANPLKIETKLGVSDITLATHDEVKRLTGAHPGFIGPLDLKIPFYADNSAKSMTNFLCAANENGIHYKNVNWNRDLSSPEFSDFLLAEEGDECPHLPGKTYKIQRGIEVGHIFNIGTRYSEKLDATFQDEEGNQCPFWMGTYGIGIGRTAQACIEQKHDERGIIWPLPIAPFQIVIVPATLKNPQLLAEAEALYTLLSPFDPLLDDRDERLGFKLKDADLIGIPYKLIVGKTFLNEGKLEIESRQGEKTLLKKSMLLDWAQMNLSL